MTKENKYIARVYYTLGCGLECGKLSAPTYKELENLVSDRINRLNNKEITFFGKTTVKVIKVVYSYPSGKKFTKNF